MKKFLLAVYIFQFAMQATAQDLVTKIPDYASAVIKYAGANLTQKVPVSKMDGYNFVKTTLLKGLKKENINTLSQTGLNFGQSAYQYFAVHDSATLFVTLLPLKDAAAFASMMAPEEYADSNMLPVKKHSHYLQQLSTTSHVAWNDTLAVIVFAQYTNPNRYYISPADTAKKTDSVPAITNMEGQIIIEQAAEAATMAVDSALAIQTTPVQKAKGAQKRTTTKKRTAPKKGTAKKPAKKAPPKPKKPAIVDEEVADYVMTEEEALENAKRNAWYDKQQQWTDEKHKTLASQIAGRVFDSSIANITREESYLPLQDNKADINMWLDYNNLIGQYYSELFSSALPGKEMAAPKDTTPGALRTGINVYFDNDRMRMESKVFNRSSELAELYKEVHNSKQNSSFTNYINADNIGFMSVSTNTEAMQKYYYGMMKSYFNKMPVVSEYGDLSSAMIDLLEIMIDEKAISDLVPGNLLFVMHNLTPKEVTYKTYEYDDNFNQKEVEKTKTEMTPDFTFVMETRNEKYLQRIVNLPVKYAKKGGYQYEKKDSYYELNLDKKNSPLNKLFFMVKNGRLIITTEKNSIDITNTGTDVAVDAITKNMVLNNNYAMKLNTKTLIQKIGSSFNTDTNKKVTEYLQQNLGEVQMESRLENGSPVAKMSMAITGQHTNSFEFFFNMMENINDIIEKGKEEEKPIQ
jgi:hypothetical protein